MSEELGVVVEGVGVRDGFKGLGSGGLGLRSWGRRSSSWVRGLGSEGMGLEGFKSGSWGRRSLDQGAGLRLGRLGSGSGVGFKKLVLGGGVNGDWG